MGLFEIAEAVCATDEGFFRCRTPAVLFFCEGLAGRSCALVHEKTFKSGHSCCALDLGYKMATSYD